MWKKPALIVGTGRCGTSIVAAQCDYMGVHMGEKLLSADSASPHGLFEDQQVHMLDTGLLLGNEVEYVQNLTPQKYRKRLERYLLDRGQRESKWGIKHPPNAVLLEDFYLPIIGEDVPVIWCRRPVEDVIESMDRSWQTPHQRNVKFATERQKALQDLIPRMTNTLTLDFEDVTGEQDTVQEIIDFLDLHPTKRQREAAESVVFDRDQGQQKVMIATPTTGMMHNETAQQRLELSHDRRYETHLTAPSYKPVTRCRNEIADRAVDGDFDYVLMIDSDTSFQNCNPLDLVRLQNDVTLFPSQISGPDGIDWNVMDRTPNGEWKEVPPGRRRSLQPVDGGGLGAALIKTDVLQEINAPFREKIVNGRVVQSEDFTFCQRAREHKFNVWCHWDYQTCHHDTTRLRQQVELRPDLPKY